MNDFNLTYGDDAKKYEYQTNPEDQIEQEYQPNQQYQVGQGEETAQEYEVAQEYDTTQYQSPRRNKHTTVDVMTFQAIVCIVIVTIFLLLNLVKVDWSQTIRAMYYDKVQTPSDEPNAITDFAVDVYNALTNAKPLHQDDSSSQEENTSESGDTQSSTDTSTSDESSAQAQGGIANEPTFPPEQADAQALAQVSQLKLAVPVMGEVTSGFGIRENPFTGEPDAHQGIDIAQEEGTPIVAAYDGTVIAAGTEELAGNYIILEHEGGLISKYMHCHTVIAREGDTVSSGQVIATVGSTGQSTGPHLHLELHVNGVAVDPLLLLDMTDNA